MQQTKSSTPNTGWQQSVLIGICIIFIVLKLVATVGMNPLDDEVYYWRWGQTFEWSYFDHPPLNAWLIGVTDFLFGTNKFGLRAGTLISFCGTVWVFSRFARKLAPEAPNNALTLSLVTFLASPSLFIWSTITYNDHLLIFFSLLALFWLAEYFSDFAENENCAPTSLYCAAIAMGAAGLTKYNAVFVGFALLVVLFSDGRLRRLLFKLHIYLAGILTAAIMLPIFIWNAQNDFASIAFHFSGRNEAAPFSTFNTASVLRFVLSTLILFGPLLIWPMARLFIQRANKQSFEHYAIRLAKWIIAPTAIMYLTISSYSPIHWYWSALSYAILCLFMWRLVREFWFYAAHAVIGLVFAVYTIFSYSALPFSHVYGEESFEIAKTFGWTQVSERAIELAEENNITLLATSRFKTAAQLSFALENNAVAELSPIVSQFDFWGLSTLPSDSNAIVIHDYFAVKEDVAKRFTRFELLETVRIERYGVFIYEFEIYLGEGFKG